jgi:hypothetical protein
MKPVLLMVIRTEPVAAWDSVGVPASIADAARTANPDFIARKEPSIVASGTTRSSSSLPGAAVVQPAIFVTLTIRGSG